MKFTKEEETELKKFGLEIINPVLAIQEGWQYNIRVEKEGSDNFKVDIDVMADEDNEDYDLIRANGNKSESGLEFEEVIELLLEGYLE